MSSMIDSVASVTVIVMSSMIDSLVSVTARLALVEWRPQFEPIAPRCSRCSKVSFGWSENPQACLETGQC